MTSINSSLIHPDWDAPDNIVAYSTTRFGGVSLGAYESLNLGLHVGDKHEHVLHNRRILPYSDSICWLDQVHGNHVAIAENSEGQVPKADAAIATSANHFCAVMTADCVPILLASQSGNEVAAIHAGWRGLSNGVIANAVNALTTPNNQLLAWVGPCICCRCYEVDLSVKAHFIDYPDAISDSTPHHFYLDLPLIAAAQLQKLGLSKISFSNLCTYCDKTQFFSHRRATQQGQKTCGRHVSVIGFR